MGRGAATAALALGSMGLALVSAEGLVRALDLVPEVHPIEVSSDASVYRRSANPLLGFELKPGYRSERADFFVSYPSTNAHGQRDVERSLEKPPGVKRVILLGDSVVEGSGIVELDHTISRRLEALYPDGEVEVLNFGVTGYCTRAEVELLEVKGLAFDPDVVVLLFVENDFQNFNRQLFRWEGRVERPGWVRTLFLGSELFRLVALRLDLWRFGVEMDPLRYNRQAIGDNNVVDGLARLAELAEREGFQPLLVVWPRFTDERIQDVHRLPGEARELVVERLARMNGIASARASATFREELRRRPERPSPRLTYSQGDQTHPNPEGTRVAALSLRRILEEHAGRPRPQPRHGPDDALAVEAARSLDRREPDYAVAWNNTGLKLVAEGRLDAAEAHYRRAIEIRPGYGKAYGNLGALLLRQGRLDDAIAQLERALEVQPTLPEAHHNLARAFEARGERERAVREYREALRLQPNLVPSREALRALGES
jgi:lysophospholipase L1-like esterase